MARLQPIVVSCARPVAAQAPSARARTGTIHLVSMPADVAQHGRDHLSPTALSHRRGRPLRARSGSAARAAPRRNAPVVAALQSPRDAHRAAARPRRDVLFGLGRRHPRGGGRTQGARRPPRRAQVDARRTRLSRQGRRQGDARAPHRRSAGARLRLARARDRPSGAVPAGAQALRELRFRRVSAVRRLRVRRVLGLHGPDALILRPATEADVPALAALARDSFVAAFGHLYKTEDLSAFLDEWRTEDAYRKALANPAKRVQLAELDGTLAAYALIVLGQSFDERPEPRPERPVFLSQLY